MEMKATQRVRIFEPNSIRVIPEIRKLLKRVLSMERNTLEYTGEEFAGYIIFKLPNLEIYGLDDVLTVCAEIGQEELGRTASVLTWSVRHPADGVAALQPREWELQDEDLAPARDDRREHAADVRPSGGW